MTEKTSLNEYRTVSNAIITLGDTVGSGKGRHFKSRFIQPGLAGYPGQFGNALIKKENLDKFVHTLRNKPVTINHKDNIGDDDKVGEVLNVWYNPEDGWYWCDGIITDETAQNLIQDKKWSVSCSYDFTKYDDEGGTENNIPYDIEFLDGEFNHLAIVDNPRYEGANIVFNSKAYNPNQPRVPTNKLADVFTAPQGGTSTSSKSIIADKINKLNPNGKDYHDMNIQNWNEQDHPRDEQGKFTDKGGETKTNTDENKPKRLRIVYREDEDYDGAIVGIFENEYGEFQALTPTISRTFKSIKGAERFLATRGYEKPNKADNNKETEMALLDELKKLITKVENDKGENMDEKIENEKTDKRKLIDEVGGILKGKVDDEIIRTIIGKMEKASYDESEAGSADNKKVKNEAEEDEKKADNKKVKNESEEDKEKVKELEKDEKEDVENKCKNSVDNAKDGFFDKLNKIYNSTVEPTKQETEYVSRADRLKAGEEYFKV